MSRDPRIFPPLRACLKFSYMLFGGLLVLVTFIDAIGDVRGGQPIVIAPRDGLIALIAGFFLIASIVGAGLFALGKMSIVSLDNVGLHGPHWLGRKITIEWNDVTAVNEFFVKGVPMFIVRSANRRRDIFGCSLGLNARQLHQYVLAHVSTDHPFVKWLESKASSKKRRLTTLRT